MLFATTLRVHSEYANIALHDLWFGRSILPVLLDHIQMRRGLRLAWKVFAVLLGLGCCIKSRVGAASASTTTRRCSASGATSAGPTSCRPTCARPSRRAWRTSTPSWAGRPSASSSAAGGRRTPWSQREGGDPDTQGKTSQRRLGTRSRICTCHFVALHFAALHSAL